jgi:hypothetical protein
LSSDREEAAISESPETVAAEMSEATDRLRDKAWMIAPLTTGAVEPPSADEARALPPE